MYVRRRKADTLEVQQMKEQKREQEKQKEKDRAILKREIAAREEIERARQETLVKFQALQVKVGFLLFSHILNKLWHSF